MNKNLLSIAFIGADNASLKKRLIALSLLALMSVPSFAKDYPNLSFSGDIKLDYDYFDGEFLEHSDEADYSYELRRLRLGLESDFTQDWSAKIKVDVQDGIELKRAYIKYDAWDWANIVVGQQTEPFGLENSISSKDLSFNENTMMTSALSPGRSYGVNVFGEQDLVTWQVGYFRDEIDEQGDAITGRLTVASVYEGKNMIHLGAAYSARQLYGEEFRINETMEVHGADSLVEGTKIDADTSSHIGAELAWQYNGFVNIAEWQRATVTETSGQQYQYDGAYVQVSYLFSGKNRKYKNGVLDSVKTSNDWELTARYSQLNLVEEESVAKVISVGLNYIVNSDLKFMADVLTGHYIDEGEDLGTGNALSLRAAYRF